MYSTLLPVIGDPPVEEFEASRDAPDAELADTPSNRRIPEQNRAGDSAIENSSIGPAFNYSRIAAPASRPAVLVRRCAAVSGRVRSCPHMHGEHA
jgi:hypothetical protein